jgi:hypothetical protein
MKRIVLLMLSLAFLYTANAQFKPRIAFDYFTNGYNERMVIPVPTSTGMSEFTIDNAKGNFRIRTGADYSFRGMTAYYDQAIYMNKSRGVTFDPLQAEWYAGVKYTRWGLTMKAEHLCIHPIGTYGVERIARYGGYNMISVGYGY